jgi:hypothetical protein
MKKVILAFSLCFIFVGSQSFVKISDNPINPINSVEKQGIIKHYAPAAPVEFKLNMFDVYETTSSEEFHGTLAAMQSARESYCPDWHHWKEWEIDDNYEYYEVIGTGMCDNPAPVFVPKLSDFAPMDAVVLTLPQG